MATQTLAARVDNLEERVTRLEELPQRVDALTSQVSQLRDEMRAEFSAVRGEMATQSFVRESIAALSTQMQAGLAEVMAQARMLYEDRKADQTLNAEGRRTRRKPRR
jgi:phosphoglycerate-specific signal transduction histidine kinase